MTEAGSNEIFKQVKEILPRRACWWYHVRFHAF